MVQVSSQHCKQTNASTGMRSNFLHSVFIAIFILLSICFPIFSSSKRGSFILRPHLPEIPALEGGSSESRSKDKKTHKNLSEPYGNLGDLMTIVTTSPACTLAQRLHCSMRALCPPGDEQQRCCGLESRFAAPIINWQQHLSRPAGMQGASDSLKDSCMLSPSPPPVAAVAWSSAIWELAALFGCCLQWAVSVKVVNFINCLGSSTGFREDLKLPFLPLFSFPAHRAATQTADLALGLAEEVRRSRWAGGRNFLSWSANSLGTVLDGG